MPRMNTMIFTKLLASSQRVAGGKWSLPLGSLRHAAGLFVLLLWGMLGGAWAQSSPSLTFYVQTPDYQTQTRYMQGEVRGSVYFVPLPRKPRRDGLQDCPALRWDGADLIRKSKTVFWRKGFRLKARPKKREPL